MIRRIVGLYFSPIGGTARMTETLISDIQDRIASCSTEQITCEMHDLLKMQDTQMDLDDETIAVIGMPVYVGKVPLPAVRMLRNIRPNGAITLAAVSYGARSFGNALYELRHFAEEQGFNVIGAGAFAVRYRNQENKIDEKSLSAFGNAAAGKIKRLAGCEIDGLRIKPAPLEVDGRMPVHGISRISPRAAAIAQGILQRINTRHRESEWYL